MKNHLIPPLCLLVASLIVAGAGLSASRRAAKGNEATAATVAYGNIWITDGSGRITQVDSAHRKVARTIRLGNFASDVTAAGGSIWAAADGAVFRIDPASGRTRLLPTPSGVTHITSGDGAVWLGSSTQNAVFRIDPQSGRRTRAMRVRGRLLGLSGGRGGVFVESAPSSGPVTGPAGARVISRVDVRRPWPTPVFRAKCDTKVSVTRDAVWLLDVCTGSLRRLDLTTERVVQFASVRTGANAFAVGFRSVWLASPTQLMRIDTKSGQPEASLPLRSSVALALSKSGLWVVSGAPKRAVFVDPRTNGIRGAPIVLGGA